MRRRFVQKDGELIEVSLDYVPEPRQHVMKDIQPYRSMIDGREITSRSTHREHLRAHGCIEVGNETKYLKPRGPLQSPPGLKDTLIRVADQKLRRR